MGKDIHNDDLNKTKKMLNQTLQELKDLKFALDASSIVSITDSKGIIIYVNGKFCDVSQYREDELMGKNHNIVNSGFHPSSFFEKMWHTLQSGNIWTGEIQNKTKRGTIYWVDTVIIPFLNDENNPYQYVSIRRDITRRKKVESEVYDLAFYDQITELPNRKLFEQIVSKKIRNAEKNDNKFAILFLDVDRFKYVNDTLGHQIGDQLLHKISIRLKDLIGEQILLSRLGGDEFAVLVEDSSVIEEVKKIINLVMCCFHEPFIVGNFEVRLTTSIGVSTFPKDGTDTVNLIKNADMALHRAKDSGKNKYELFTSSMDVQSNKIFTLENDLYKALERDEFVLYYQPRVDVKSGKIVGAEALIRWNHKKWGMVSPGDFIPLSEEIGLIIPISNWALEQVCSQNKEWQNIGLSKIPISVNLSTKHFMQKDLISTIKNVLNQTDLDPMWLEIEITENILVKNSDFVVEVLNQLKEMGIKIALDDFGTGYCSLSYLKDFSMDTVKIDKSFIRNIPHNPVDTAIVSSVINLARILQKKVVAEGVETEEQLIFLYEKYCDEIQGFYYSKPVTSNEFQEMLQKGASLLPKQYEVEVKTNRRKYMRLQLDNPLQTKMSIKEFNGQEILLGYGEVLIEDIGVGGLRFNSPLTLPVNNEIFYRIETEVIGKNLQILGQIVWSKAISNGKFEYGIQFLMSENQRAVLLSSLDSLSLQG